MNGFAPVEDAAAAAVRGAPGCCDAGCGLLAAGRGARLLAGRARALSSLSRPRLPAAPRRWSRRWWR
jgi:hypothetical protein